MIRLNYRVKLAQHQLEMWQYISRCLQQLNPASWRKEQLELFPAASWRLTVIHSMNAYVWCWSKICGSLDEIPSVTMGSFISKILNEF